MIRNMKTDLQALDIPELPFNIREALNQLRTNLTFCGDEKKVIMITSSTPDEGKSFISVNLWKMIAEMGNSVLLLDMDLRNSTICRKYKMEDYKQKKGIQDYLSGKCKLSEALWSTPIEHGYVLPVTNTIVNPSILIETKRFKDMFEILRQTFDYIIVDTPPVQVVADALTVSKECDGMLLVVRSNSVPRKIIANTVNSLKRTGIPLLGTVLNRFEIDNKMNSYYYYSHYYYHNSYGSSYGPKGSSYVKRVRKSGKSKKNKEQFDTQMPGSILNTETGESLRKQSKY